MVRYPLSFPRPVQRALLTVLTLVSRLRMSRRRAPLPAVGDARHLTAVIRLPPSVVPDLGGVERHYVYPAGNVHVTVLNLDGARADLETARRRLSDAHLDAPTLSVEGVGCSRDTIFLRCVHDRAFGRLREQVRDAFEADVPASPSSWIFDRLSFANVVRFDGRGNGVTVECARHDVLALEMEIVRTDRYLSDTATVVLVRLPLRSPV